MSDKRENHTLFYYLITALVILSFGLLYLLLSQGGLFRADTESNTDNPSPNDEITQLKREQIERMEQMEPKNQLAQQEHAQLENEKTDPQKQQKQVNTTATADSTNLMFNTRETPPEAASIFTAPPAAVQGNQALTLATITFKAGSTMIEPSSQDGIQALANLLDAQKDIHLLIRGHTDNIGSPDANTLLSLTRSDSLKNTLTQWGIDPQRIKIEGVGSLEPVASNDTPAGREQNRRLELLITR